MEYKDCAIAKNNQRINQYQHMATAGLPYERNARGTSPLKWSVWNDTISGLRSHDLTKLRT